MTVTYTPTPERLERTAKVMASPEFAPVKAALIKANGDYTAAAKELGMNPGRLQAWLMLLCVVDPQTGHIRKARP